MTGINELTGVIHWNWSSFYSDTTSLKYFIIFEIEESK